uniref:SWIM-type domain-containing protein n=1 Tax=Setaria italica TaxID=4555 RepID=K4AJM9_SETIT
VQQLENGEEHINAQREGAKNKEIIEEEANESQELTEEQVDEFLHNEQLAASEGNNADIDSKYTSQIGMQFKDREDAHRFFCFYGFLAGFEVVTTHIYRTSSRKRNNEVYKVEMKCHRYGKESDQKQNEEEAEQEPMLVEDEPNEANAKEVEKRNTNVQIRTNCPVVVVMIAILSYLRGGILALPYKNKDVANYRTKINKEVKGNDMTKALEYFRQRKYENPTFFYEFSFDEEKKVKNIFWREGCSLKYYAEYGDCVSFDATYMTKRCNLPFAPFVGVTGHGRTYMFGCAFISDESTPSFAWIFETLLKSMGGKQPKTIITYQDKAMKAAIKMVFPNTVHRNCFFHIKYKCYNKNGEFEDIVNNSLTKQEFEFLWQKMIKDYGLQDNKYFNKMWEDRANFIPVWFKDNFYPFLQSTGRSEGSNARLKENVGPTYSIISFLKEFQRMVDATNIREDVEDKHSKEKRPKQLMYGYNVEKQAKRLKYKEIEKGKCFEVWPKTNQVYKPHRIRKYIVLTDLTEGRQEFSCICGKFNKDGILCAHILKVILEEEINQLLEKYIIDRWRKKDNKMNLQLREEVPKTNEMLRFNIQINSKASNNEEVMQYLSEELDRINYNLDLILSGVDNDEGQSNAANLDGIIELNNPQVKQKGRPALPKRLKPLIEEIKQKIIKQENKKIAKAKRR